jgi:Cu2+-exporting ATPase
MMPMLPLAAAGGALGGALALARKRTRRARNSRELLRQHRLMTGSLAQARAAGPADLSLAELARLLRRWDAHYQAFMLKHVDPRLVGRAHSEQLKTLSRGALRELSAAEADANRRLLLGVGTFGYFALGPLVSLPLTPVLLIAALYSISPALTEGWRIVTRERRFSMMHLMLIYLSVLWFGGWYLIGSLGIIFMNLTRKVELLVKGMTRNDLTHLLGEQPRTVWVKHDGCEIEIPFADLAAGDILVLDAGHPVPVDGVVVAGSGSVDQHRLTGESQPVEKAAGDPVLASTLVLGGRLEVRVERTGAETVAARIGEVLSQTIERQESRLGDLYRTAEAARWPLLGLGAFGWLVGGPVTGAALLGCNYLVSLVPLRLMTVLNGLKAGATRGVLIKDARALERLAGVDTVVFDKTGTLTDNRLQVRRVLPAGDREEAEVLRLAAAAEQRQHHPVACAILDAAEARGLTLPALDEASVALGMGLTARVGDLTIRVGSARFLDTEQVPLPPAMAELAARCAAAGTAAVFVAAGDSVIGAMELTATLRPEAAAVIAWLREQGIATYIISGDHEAPTRSIAEALGLDGWFADTLPQQKAQRVRSLQDEGRSVCFVGDGINDAVALRQADVSISLKGATTVATDAAQMVLMDDDLGQLPLAWEIARGFERSIADNRRLAVRFSGAAAAGALLLPYKFLIVELGWGAQGLLGLKVASRPLADEAPATLPAAPARPPRRAAHTEGR